MEALAGGMYFKTVIPRARVGCKIVGYNILIFNKREWNTCFIKNNQKNLLILICKMIVLSRERF